jgi:PAS domain S-box-containing protein
MRTEEVSMSGVTIWIGEPRGGRLQVAQRLASRWPEQPLHIASPAAAAAGEGLEGCTLAILDLRPGGGLAGPLLGLIGERLLAAGCAALVVSDEREGAVGEAELEATYAATLAVLGGSAGCPAAADTRAWLIAAARLGIATTLPDGRILRTNAELLELLGAAGLEEVLGRPLETFMARPASLAWDERETGGARVLEAEVDFLRGDGSRVWARLCRRPLPGPSATAGFEVVATELSSERDIRGALAVSEQRYRRLVDAMAEGVIECGPDGQVRVWNAKAERMLGVPARGFVGRHWLASGWEIVREDGSPFPLQDLPLARTLLTGEPHSDVVVGLRPAAGSRAAAGHAENALRWLSVSSRTIGRGPAGSLGAVASFSDITEKKKLEMHLARLQREETMILDSVPAFIWYKDTENRIRRVNRYAAEALKLPAEAVVGRSTAELYPEEAAAYHRDDLEVIATGRPKLGILEPLRTAGGEQRWVETSKVPYFDDSGAITGVIVLAIDVTERRRAEDQLRLLQSAAEQTLDGIVVIHAGQPRRIVYANPAVEMITGLAQGELLGASPSLLIGAGTDQREVRRLRRCMAEGKPFRGEVTYRSRGSSSGQLDLRLEPLRGPDNEITHWVGLGRDITAQQAVLAERERLRLMISRSLLEWQQTFDAIAMPVLLLDPEGRVSRLNEAARNLAGRRFSECLGQRLPLLAGGEPWTTAARLAARMLGGSGMAPALREQPAEAGRTWEVRVHPQPGGGGVIVTLHDLTDLVALQESLRRSATMSAMGMLVAGVAHEVRNPLFGLSALIEAFESQPEPRQAFPAEPFKRGLTRLQSIMQQLLDYGQPAPLVQTPQPLLRTLQEAVEACRGLARERQVEVALAAAPGLPPVVMDESRILQVFLNLLDNAVQHSPAGSRVVLAAAAAGGWLECRVEDAGPGVAEADQAKVFEPFFTRRRGGTGLGLAIVQKIVVEHGGAVCCGSRPGGGTVMTVRLPQAVHSGQPVLAG